MMTRRLGLVASAFSLLCLLSTTANAQSVEVGVGIGRACAGSEGDMCGPSGGAAFGGYAAVWFGDHLALQGEVTRMGRPDQAFVHEPGIAGPPYEVRVERTDRSRTLLAFEAQYHFGAVEHPVRFFVHGGLAPFVDTITVTCLPEGCGDLPRQQLGGERLGDLTTWHTAVVVGGGLAARLPAHLMLRGTFSLYNPGGESLATSAAMASLGYRF